MPAQLSPLFATDIPELVKRNRVHVTLQLRRYRTAVRPNARANNIIANANANANPDR